MIFKVVVLLTQSEPFDVFTDAYSRLKQEYPGVLSIRVYDTELLDQQEELYKQCEKETLEADFILMYLHGTVTNFLRFKAAGRGMWDASEDIKDQLRSLYMEVEGDIEELNDH